MILIKIYLSIFLLIKIANLYSTTSNLSSLLLLFFFPHSFLFKIHPPKFAIFSYFNPYLTFSLSVLQIIKPPSSHFLHYFKFTLYHSSFYTLLFQNLYSRNTFYFSFLHTLHFKYSPSYILFHAPKPNNSPLYTIK